MLFFYLSFVFIQFKYRPWIKIRNKLHHQHFDIFQNFVYIYCPRHRYWWKSHPWIAHCSCSIYDSFFFCEDYNLYNKTAWGLDPWACGRRIFPESPLRKPLSYIWIDQAVLLPQSSAGHGGTLLQPTTIKKIV